MRKLFCLIFLAVLMLAGCAALPEQQESNEQQDQSGTYEYDENNTLNLTCVEAATKLEVNLVINYSNGFNY